MQIFTKIQQLGLGFDAHFSWIDADNANQSIYIFKREYKKSKFIFNVSELNSNPISPISYSVGVYCFIGCELSVGLDLVAWNDELISIFYDSMSYDN